MAQSDTGGAVWEPGEYQPPPGEHDEMQMGKEGQEALRDPWFEQPESGEVSGDGVQV